MRFGMVQAGGGMFQRDRECCLGRDVDVTGRGCQVGDGGGVVDNY